MYMKRSNAVSYNLASACNTFFSVCTNLYRPKSVPLQEMIKHRSSMTNNSSSPCINLQRYNILKYSNCNKFIQIDNLKTRTWDLSPNYYYKFDKYTNYFEKRMPKSDNGRAIVVVCGLAFVIAHCSQNLKDVRFFRAVKYGSAEELGKMIVAEKIDVNQKHQLGWTALQVAVINNKESNVKVLLAAGADPNITDDFSNLNKMARENRMHPLDVLQKREEEFSERLNHRASFTGFTALMYAALIDNVAILKLLLEGGANPTIENEAGLMARDYAYTLYYTILSCII